MGLQVGSSWFRYCWSPGRPFRTQVVECPSRVRVEEAFTVELEAGTSRVMIIVVIMMAAVVFTIVLNNAAMMHYC